MDLSIFSKIIKGDIPCHKIYEDELTFAFLDIHPVQPGHVLVVPKTQVQFLWDLDDSDYQAVMATSKKLAKHIREVLNVPYVGIKVFGLDVPHTHVHLIPFSSGAEYSNRPDMTADADQQALSEMAKKLAI